MPRKGDKEERGHVKLVQKISAMKWQGGHISPLVRAVYGVIGEATLVIFEEVLESSKDVEEGNMCMSCHKFIKNRLVVRRKETWFNERFFCFCKFIIIINMNWILPM